MADNKIVLKDADLEKKQTLTRIFQKADRTITGEEVKCRVAFPDWRTVSPTGGAPAMNDGEVITFDGSQIGDLTDLKELVALNGLNYHELAHLLYTPRQRSIPSTLRGYYTFRTFNVLEDQRIESMFTSLYPATKAYFTMTVMKHIVGNAKPETIFPLIWGRKYLGIELRTRLARIYRNQHHVEEIKAIIDEYRTLTLPREMSRATELVLRMNALVSNSDMDNSDPFQHSSRNKPMNRGKVEGARDQDAAHEFREQEDEVQDEIDKEAQAQLDQEDQERAEASNTSSNSPSSESSDSAEEAGEDAEGTGSDESEDGSEESENGSEGGSEESANESEEGSEDGEGSGDSDEAEGADDADNSATGSGDLEGEDAEEGDSEDPEGSDNSSSTEASGGSGVGNTSPVPLDREDIDREIEKIKAAGTESISNVMSNADVVSDAESKRKLVLDGDGKVSLDDIPQAEVDKYREVQLDGTHRNVSKKVGMQFERIARDLDPGFLTHRDSGRVNVQRAMRGDDLDTVFDQWDSGKYDAAEMEIVLGVDISTSMAGHMTELSEAVWTILQSLQSLGKAVSVTALTFNTTQSVIYGGKVTHLPNKAPIYKAQGGTNPDEMLETAKRIFRATSKKNRILLMLSDGSWGNTEDNNATIASLNAAGVVTGLMHFDDPNSAFWGPMTNDDGTPYDFSHGAKVFHRSKSLSDLIPFVSGVVKKSMKG